MAFPTTMIPASNDEEYDAKAHTDYDLHRQRAHKQNTGHGKAHKDKAKAAKAERAWRTAPRLPTTARHARHKSIVVDDDDDDDDDASANVAEEYGSGSASDASDEEPELQETHSSDGILLSDLVTPQTVHQDFLHVSDFYLAQPSTSLSISSLATPIPQYTVDEADSLLGPDLGFGHVGTWMPSKRNSGSSTMHMRSSSRGSSKGHEPETTVHVMDSKW